MFDEDNYGPFDPFNVGPPNHGRRLEINLPTCVTYPPPVFVTFPPPKQHTNLSVSQNTLAVQQAAAKAASQVQESKSQMGEVAISKAINEEMAAAKQQAAVMDQQRIDAGGVSQTTLARTKKSHSSLKTLLASNTKLQGSTQSSVMGMAAAPEDVKRMSSRSSVRSNQSTASKMSSKTSVMSGASAASTAKSVSSMRGDKPKEGVAPSKTSLRSHRSKATDSNSTLKSQKSAKKSASRATLKSRLSAKASKTSKIGRTLALKETVGRTAIASAPKATALTLMEQAEALSDRLKAGNEQLFKRFNALNQTYTSQEPRRMNSGDRMSYWFKDAVLS